MTKEKFIWLLKNSVKITTEEQTDTIFYYMDHMIERKIKLNNILDNNKTIILNNIDKKYILFEQNRKNKDLWIDYDQIWKKLEDNIEYKDMSIRKLIDGWLKDDTNWRHYTPNWQQSNYLALLKDDTNWRHYTPLISFIIFTPSLKDDTNWRHYTPH